MFPVTEQAPALRRADGSPVRVLVVDDEATLSELLSMALRYEGWEVRTVGDGSSAVRTAREFGPTPRCSTSCSPTSTASRCCGGCAPSRPRSRCSS